MTMRSPKLNTFLKPSKQIKSPSKTIAYFYKIVEILFCLNLGFVHYKTQRVECITKYVVFYFSLSLSVGTVICSFFFSPVFLVLWHTYYMTLYIFFVVIIFRKKTQLYSLFRELEVIDLKLNDATIYNLDVKFIIPLLCAIIYRTALVITYCTNNPCAKPTWILIVFLCAVVTSDVLLVTNSLMFYSVYVRLVSFSRKVAGTEIGSALAMYKSIADIADKVKIFFDPVIATVLLYNIPQVMLTIYGIVQRWTKQPEWVNVLDLTLEYFEVIVMLTLTFVPALLAGRLSSQATKIKVILHDRLLNEQDHTKWEEINNFILYIEARSLVYRTYKIIPLDAKLICLVLNFCVTYLIIIIQFSHLY